MKELALVCHFHGHVEDIALASHDAVDRPPDYVASDPTCPQRKQFVVNADQETERRPELKSGSSVAVC
jgi:hypothetical protein